MNAVKLFVMASLLVGVSACAITTTYGKDPQPVPGERNAYRFTIYYNMYTTQADIQAKAETIARELQTQQRCQGYRLQAIPSETFGAQDIDYIARLQC